MQFKTQEQLKSAQLNLLQNVQTRWNSEFFMIERLIKMKEVINFVLSNMDHLVEITKSECQLADDLISILRPLEGATRTLCGESYQTISMVIPKIRAMINHFSQLLLSNRDILKMRAWLVTNIKERYFGVKQDDIFRIATLIDPRFKEARFSKEEYSQQTVVYLFDLLKDSSLISTASQTPLDVVNVNEPNCVDNDFSDILNKNIRTRYKRDLDSSNFPEEVR